MAGSTRTSATSTSPRLPPARSTSAASAAWSASGGWCAAASPRPAPCSATSARRSMPSLSIATASRASASTTARCSATRPATAPMSGSTFNGTKGKWRWSALGNADVARTGQRQRPLRRDHRHRAIDHASRAGSTPPPAGHCSNCPPGMPARQSSWRSIRSPPRFRVAAATACQRRPSLGRDRVDGSLNLDLPILRNSPSWPADRQCQCRARATVRLRHADDLWRGAQLDPASTGST